ncbi:hypothetical protein [Chitinilyticum litopenaei]|uniref:hypothetical protein n=1 Tax=Chitinilyticum litopenaei TaxID=1121276 RepID=UPI0004025843|nr:hypothetical protein [Chitinilyticum litopenaei]
MQYQLVIFDRIQAGFPVPTNFADVQALQQSLRRNPPCSLPKSDRLPHLASILLDRFPLEGTDEQECIWHVGEEFEEEFGDLMGDAKAAVNHGWHLTSPGGERLIVLMRELLPLLQVFGLDLFDLTGGFYLCNAGQDTSCWRLDSGEPFDPELYFPATPPIDVASLPAFVDRPGRPPSSLLVFDLYDLKHWGSDSRREFSLAGGFHSVDQDDYCEAHEEDRIEKLPGMVKALQHKQFPPTSSQRQRLERLVVELLKRFPYPRPAAEEVWQGFWPLAQIQTQTVQAWRPSIRPERYAEFMAALLPLARELRLDVIDVHLGIYFMQAKKHLAIPSVRQALLYQLDPSAASWKKPNEAKRMKTIQAVLDPALTQAGFELLEAESHACRYRREIAGGYQLIKALQISTPRYDKKQLIITCESYSLRRGRAWELEDWVAQGQHPADFSAPSNLKPGCALSLQFPLLPLTPENEWVKFSESLQDCHTETQASIIAQQVIEYGLPMLHEARTVKGMVRLYSDPQWKDGFIYNLHGKWQQLSWKMLYYAHVAQDERLGQWAQFMQQCCEDLNWKMMRPNFKQDLREGLSFKPALWAQYEPVDPDGVA